ncbi:hypothetical protein [Rhodovulum sp. PH10]|uniref:hypothetical protein n=1 Tax=Rhodovulum sp. PH10 TaxID=1187851 RepID=UPI000A074CDB|nr:hypothetical protein [Rhodovulum sp. PH10]
MNDLEIFCRQVRERSAEHRRAVEALGCADAPSQLVSILRQELDSMVRVIYVLAQPDNDYRQQLITASVNGHRWKRSTGKGHVTDREMIELAQHLHGWTASVYKFGCAFIHLSNLHDHKVRDGFLAIDASEREDIIRHLRYYHGGPSTEAAAFADIIPFFPRVFEKIADNLECYVETLEAGQGLDEYVA